MSKIFSKLSIFTSHSQKHLLCVLNFPSVVFRQQNSREYRKDLFLMMTLKQLNLSGIFVFFTSVTRVREDNLRHSFKMINLFLTCSSWIFFSHLRGIENHFIIGRAFVKITRKEKQLFFCVWIKWKFYD